MNEQVHRVETCDLGIDADELWLMMIAPSDGKKEKQKLTKNTHTHTSPNEAIIDIILRIYNDDTEVCKHNEYLFANMLELSTHIKKQFYTLFDTINKTVYNKC